MTVIEHECPGMEATDISYQQEIPGAEPVPILVEITSERKVIPLNCPFLVPSQWGGLCLRPEMDKLVSPNPNRLSFRVNCRYDMQNSGIWWGRDGLDVNTVWNK